MTHPPLICADGGSCRANATVDDLVEKLRVTEAENARLQAQIDEALQFEPFKTWAAEFGPGPLPAMPNSSRPVTFTLTSAGRGEPRFSGDTPAPADDGEWAALREKCADVDLAPAPWLLAALDERERLRALAKLHHDALQLLCSQLPASAWLGLNAQVRKAVAAATAAGDAAYAFAERSNCAGYECAVAYHVAFCDKMREMGSPMPCPCDLCTGGAQ